MKIFYSETGEPAGIKFVIFMIIISGLILISGCTSQPANTVSHTNTVQQTSAAVTNQSSVDQYWIAIDPIRDFRIDPSSTITGSELLNISGTTNFPAGTRLGLYLIGQNRPSYVFQTTLDVGNNTPGQNSFSYTYDMIGNSPGQYLVAIVDPSGRSYPTFEPFDVTAFNATSGKTAVNTKADLLPSLWIRMDPIGQVQKDKNILIFGTTNLPAGTNITVSCDFYEHGCIFNAPPDTGGERTLCGRGCHDWGSYYTVARVVERTRGVNTWNATVDTTGLCDEIYVISASAANWSNVTSVSQKIVIP
jgi:hypothetical protein